MDPFIATLMVLFGIIIIPSLMGWGTWKLLKWAMQHDRRVLIERDMRQGIRDREYEQKAADKILREQGYRP